MKPAGFEYHRPDSATEAVELLAGLGEDAKLLSGGQSMIPMLALRLMVFEHLIDIGRITELTGIERHGGEHGDERHGDEHGDERHGDERHGDERPGGTVRIGANTTEAAVERSAEVASAVPLLARATPFVGHVQIRNRGTVGGSLAHADPAAEYPAVALALDAALEALSPRGTRTIAASDFFTGLWSTALEPDEMLTGVAFPVWTGRCGFAVEEIARRHGDFAIAGAVVAVELNSDDRVERCGIALIGMGSTPERATGAEAAASGRRPTEIEAGELGRTAVADLTAIPADLHASAHYREQVGATMVERAWWRAVEEAQGG